jgi:hypothetical protein
LTLAVALPVRAQSTGGGKPAEEKWTQAELESQTRAIMADLERLRGKKFLRPVEVRVSSKEELLTYIKLREDKTTPPEQFAADELIAKLLGALAPDVDLRARMYAMLEAQVGGFYDPDSDSFSLMEWVPRGLTKIILAHELDHALDDQLADIDGTLKKIGDRTDAILAYHSVVEGSGTAVMTQWMLQAGDSSSMASLSESQQKEILSMANAPEWLWKPMMGLYTVGAAFLGKTSSWATAGAKPLDPTALETAFREPPRSTEQVLHPDKYWNETQRDEPRRIRFETDKLKDWKVRREDTLGELLIAIVTTPPALRNQTDFANPMALLGIRFTNEIAAGWGGDGLLLLENGPARLLRWVTVWDTEKDAGEFYGAMSQQQPALLAAAKTLGTGSSSDDCGATVEYGESKVEVVLTVYLGTSRAELKRTLRGLTHSIP